MPAVDPVKESDWYSVLGLPPQASTEQIRAAVEKMSRQASALANTAPHRSQELREITRAIKRDLLSGAETRQRYDLSRQDRGTPPSAPPATPVPEAAVPSAAAGPAGAGLGARLKRFMQASWTCPACGEGAMPNDKFCKACGTSITPPVVARGTYFCGTCGTPLRGQENFCNQCGTRRVERR